MRTITMILPRLHARALEFAGRSSQWAQQRERGDVPGWVLVTVMTAGLVAVLWLIAEPLLSNLFSDAVEGVTGP